MIFIREMISKNPAGVIYLLVKKKDPEMVAIHVIKLVGSRLRIQATIN